MNAGWERNRDGCKRFRMINLKDVLRRCLFSITSLFFIIILVFQAGGIGITPGRTVIDFEPGLRKEISFSIINSEHRDMAVLFTVRGELNQSIILHEVYAEFSSREESKSFSYEAVLPEKFERPGRYEGEIVALELPKDFRSKGTFVGATLAVISQLHVHVPYPGKYVEAEVNVVPGEETLFFVPVVSRGKLDIASLRAVIDIYSLDKKIASLETEDIKLKSLERKELVARWKADTVPGTYKVKVNVFYDNEIAYTEKEFILGELALEILEIYVKDFQLGGIAKFNAIIENHWSLELKDVFLNILMYNLEGEVMADIKSAHYTIPGLSKSELVVFWDTAGVREGIYDGKIVLNYGKISERPVKVQVGQDEIVIIGVTGRVITRDKGRLNIQTFLIGAVLVLIVVNIIWFIVIKKMVKRKNREIRERGVEHAVK